VAANGHWPGYAKSADFEIVAVVDPAEARRKAALAFKKDLKVFPSIEALAGERLDFVDICTPPASHVEFAGTALANGWDVLCEKPLTLSAADYEILSSLVSRHAKTLFTVHNWKHAQIFQKAFELIRKGRLGRIWHTELYVLRNSHCKGASEGSSNGRQPAEDWRTNKAVAGGGILVDHGWHAFYLLFNLMGVEPSAVSMSMQTGAGDLEEAARGVISFGDAEAFLKLTWRAPNRRNAAIIHGEKGVLIIDDVRIILAAGGMTEEFHFDAALSAGSHHADWFEALLPAFREELDHPTGKNFREAGWCAALMQASYASAALNGKTVPVAPPELKPALPR
jgi:predicted dehydrogenase